MIKETGFKKRVVPLILLVITILIIASRKPGKIVPVLAQSGAIPLTPAIQEPSTVGEGEDTYDIFRDEIVTFIYDGGSVCLSSQESVCSAPAIDDAIRIYVNGIEKFYYESKTHDFGPIEFSDYLHSGSNEVRVQLIDLTGPERGGSALWLVPISGGITPPLQLLSVYPSKSQVELRENYFITVLIHNSANVPQGGNLILTESGVLTDYNDSQYSAAMSIEVPANTTKTFVLGPIYHEYHWIFNADEVVGDCAEFQSLFTDIVIEAFGKYIDTVSELPQITNSVELFALLDQVGSARLANAYQYGIGLEATGLSQEKQTEVTVVVPTWKQSQFAQSVIVDFYWPAWSVAGIGALASPYTAPAGGYLLSNEVYAWQGSCLLKENALDPDSNYQQIVEPLPMNVPDLINNLPEGSEKEATLNIIRFINDMYPLNTSLGRYEGAKRDDETFWATEQLIAARKYATTLLYDLYSMEGTVSPIVNQTVITQEDVEYAKQYILDNGLPQFEQDLLTELGVENEQIQGLEQVFLEWADTSILDWPDTSQLDNASIAIYEELINYLNSRIQEYAGENTDITPPTSTITIEGDMGLNGWITSNVTITISASDDNSGAGVETIEWSTDNGWTWQQYIEPFEIDEEGSFHLMVRAIDFEGNIEFPPATADFKIDKTPPETVGTLLCSRSMDGICRSEVTVTLSAIDNISGINTTWYKLNDSSEWLLYTEPIIIQHNGSHELQYKSTDNAGNEENPVSSGSISIQRFIILANNLLNIDSATTYQADGVAHSNGDVSLINNTTVYLDTLNYVGQFIQSGNVSLTINEQSQVSNLFQMPIYPLDFYKEHCTYHEGSLALFDTSVAYDECFYVTGNVWIFTTGVTGTLSIISEGTIYDYSTNASLQAWDTSNGVLFYGVEGYVTYATGAEYTGIIYTPNSEIDGSFTNWILNGGLFGNNTTIGGGTTLYATQAPGFPATTHQLPLDSNTTPPTEPTPTPTITATPSPTQEPTVTPTPSPTATSQPTQTPISTSTPTFTPLPPTPSPTVDPPSQDPPSMPMLLSPSDGGTADRLQATFGWSDASGATAYQLQVATLWLFSGSYLVIDVSPSISEYTFTQDLEPNKNYYWRVRAVNDVGYSDWTSDWEFVAPVPPPSLSSPANESTVADVTPTFSWLEDPDTYRSQIQISLSSDFNTLVFEDETWFDDYDLSQALESGTTYYWRVRSQGFFSDYVDWWSPIWSFTTPN